MDAGAAEVSISPAISYETRTTPEKTNDEGAKVSGTTTQLGVGTIEGNVLYGLTDAVGLNLHVSSAGIQPGVRVALLQGGLNIALLPAIAVGYHSVVEATDKTTGGTTTTTTAYDTAEFGFLAGIKVLLSAESGPYGGIGYDYQRIATDMKIPDSPKSTHIYTSHNLGFAFGYEIRPDSLRIRPELAAMLSPSGSLATEQEQTTTTEDAGWAFLLLPNVTVAAAGGR